MSDHRNRDDAGDPPAGGEGGARGDLALHDLNQPITALLLYLDAALMLAGRSEAPLPERLVSLIEKARAEAERAQALLRGLPEREIDTDAG